MPKVGGKRRKTRTHAEDDDSDVIGKIPKSTLLIFSFYH
jgi:hypothetical protein